MSSQDAERAGQSKTVLKGIFLPFSSKLKRQNWKKEFRWFIRLWSTSLLYMTVHSLENLFIFNNLGWYNPEHVDVKETNTQIGWSHLRAEGHRWSQPTHTQQTRQYVDKADGVRIQHLSRKWHHTHENKHWWSDLADRSRAISRRGL